MNRSTILALAATVLSATTSLTTSAHAGMGIRLGFGFPLGSFVAHPSHGSGPSSAPSYSQKHCAKKAPVYHEAAKPAYHPEPKVARHVEDDKTVRSVKRSTNKTDVAEASHKVETPETKPVTEADGTTPVTGSTALVQTSTGTQSTPAPEVAKTEEVATIIDTNAPAATANAVGTPAPATAEPAKVEETTAVAEAQNTTGDCKKFIPIIGITVSIGCGK